MKVRSPREFTNIGISIRLTTKMFCFVGDVVMKGHMKVTGSPEMPLKGGILQITLASCATSLRYQEVTMNFLASSAYNWINCRQVHFILLYKKNKQHSPRIGHLNTYDRSMNIAFIVSH